MNILGIETSCDETAVAIYSQHDGLLANCIYTQTSHQQYGGVVPELASRDHVLKLAPMISEALADANLSADQIDGVAYTAYPGLVGALLVGATLAKGLGYAWQVPTLAVHHMEGHLLAPMLEINNRPEYPFIALLVSGGHTQLYDVSGVGCYQLLGESLDDAAGEAFDKTAKLLGMPYPGGPELAKLADQGNDSAFNFPRPMLSQPGLNFSFSGLKTAVAQLVWQHPDMDDLMRADIAASFQQAVVEVLVEKCRRALAQCQRDSLVVAGGVSANRSLQTALKNICAPARVFLPPASCCTDNAAMIAYAGLQHFLAGKQDNSLEITVKARCPLS